MSLKNLVRGREATYRGRNYLAVERKLHEVESGNLGDYVRKHKEGLFMRNLRQHLPELAHVQKDRMLFFDIETGGVTNDSPILSIALAHMGTHTQYDLDLECVVARNPYEEKGILGYFASLLPHYDAFFTYNGKSFDIPRINSRLIQNGLYLGQPLKEVLGDRNHDLYWIGQKEGKIHLSDKRLQTLEKALPVFGFKRKRDVEGEDIPKFYLEYVYKRKSGQKKVRLDTDIAELARKDVKEVLRLQQENGQEVNRKMYNSYLQGAYEARGGTTKTELTIGRTPIALEKVEENMARIINHNFLDVVSLAAILSYIITGKKPLHEEEVPF